MNGPIMIAARRSAVVPRDGAFRGLELHDLAAPVIDAALRDAGLAAGDVDAVILGNALYGGGNPARVAALAAALPEHVPAMTIDTQCCAGLDAIVHGAGLIRAGMARVVVAGGAESFSRAPIRMRRPRGPDEAPIAYKSPPFTPWPDRDPEMLASAAEVARDLAIGRDAQEAFAVASHAAAWHHDFSKEIVPVAGVVRDAFTRALSPGVCARLPVLEGDAGHGVTAATVAVEADAAAVVVLVAEGLAAGRPGLAVRAGLSRGGAPERPALAPIAAAREVLAMAGLRARDLAAAEVMEAFAAQALACIHGIGIDPAIVNRRGGALARGHPIGASGAILAVRLWHDLVPEGGCGLATIAGAGGLASALVLEAISRS